MSKITRYFFDTLLTTFVMRTSLPKCPVVVPIMHLTCLSLSTYCRWTSI